MSTYRVIFSGRLDFGTPRSFQKVVELYNQRFEVYFRKDVLLKAEDVFKEDLSCFDVPRFQAEATEKTWRNTLALIQYISDFAVAGQIRAWRTQDGKLLEAVVLEPKGEKEATQAFLRGRDLIQETGAEAKAIELLSRAIEKFDRHALAFERRGRLHYLQNRYEEALQDYNQSIQINPDIPEAYLGKGLVHIWSNQVDTALEALDLATKKSIPHQPIYWQARRLKGECFLSRGEYQQAKNEFKPFCDRAFEEGNPNQKWKRRSLLQLGIALKQLNEQAEAQKALEACINLPGDDDADEIQRAKDLLQKISSKPAGRKEIGEKSPLRPVPAR